MNGNTLHEPEMIKTRIHDGVRIECRRVTVDSIPVYYEVAGTGAPLVLIHGLSGSTRWWERNIVALARHFRVYVVDLIGFGQSRGAQPFVLRDASRIVCRWMECLGIERAHIVGHSMGGYIAAELAADCPERVDQLVLVAAAALPFDPSCSPEPLNLIRSIPRINLSFLSMALSDAYNAGLSTLARATYELLTSDIRPKLSRISAPTLVMWGEQDICVPLKQGRQLSEYLPDARFVVFKTTGHCPMWEHPEAFNRVVSRFLTGGVRSIVEDQVLRAAVQPAVRAA